MRDRIIQLVFFSCFILAPALSWGQSLSDHNWYFGNSTNGIRFSRSDHAATLITKPPMPGTGGSAVASDQTNGNLLFYTNGATLFDITGAPMINGSGLSGNINGNQPVAVALVPGQTNQYFVITNSADFSTGGSINYTLVDMAQLGNATPPTPALGDVTTPKDQAIASIPASSEAMITIPHSNGTDFWLITHENGTTNYAVTLFTATGPTSTTVIPSGLIQRAGNLSYNAATGDLAVSPQEANRNVEIIAFDNTTGTFTSNVSLANSGVPNLTTQAIYDIEWSASGQYAYVSQAGEAGVQANVLQFDLTDPTIPPVSILPQPPGIDFSHGLQMGPDSAIYHLYQVGGNFFLGKINEPDSVATLVEYEAQAFPGNVNFNAKQFPSFTPATDIDLTVSFVTGGSLCMNSPITFYPTVSPGADSLVWDFGDGSTSNQWAPVHTYEAGGAMTAQVTAYLNGQSETFSLPINITDFDIQITLVQDTTACSCELPFPKIPTPPCTPFTLTAEVSGAADLQWHGPAGLMGTTTTLQPDSAGYYYLTATVGGCQTYAGVNIKEYDVDDQRTNIWYFGDRAGLDFNSLYWTPPTSGPVPITNGVMNAPEGTSTISDRNGQVIFFTDGDRVWNRQNVEIANGIGGDPGSTQSAIIIPVPGDETLFYIFTTQEVHGTGTYELRYVLFDLKENNGTGGIVSPSSVLFARSTERITASANWLIAHEYGNNSFRAYEITAEGIGSPVISGVGSDHAVTNPNQGQGYMILGPQNQLVVALDNTIEMFDFVDSSGVVMNHRIIDVEQPGQAYGIGFSGGGQKLYTTLLGENFIYELAYDSALGTYTRRPELPPLATTVQPGAIQRGPDGQIYVALQGSTHLGSITPSDVVTPVPVPSQFNENAVELFAGTSSTLGLPNFIQSLGEPLQSPGLTASDGCVNTELTFAATGKDSNIDKFDWLFGDGNGMPDGGPEVTHTYTSPGTYSLSVRVYNKCEEVGVFTQTIVISDNPLVPPMLASDQLNVICGDQPLTLIAANTAVTGETYLWSTGETTRTIQVTEPNQYSVTVTNASGCTATNTVDIYPYFGNLDLGPDQVVCQNEVRRLTPNVQGATYSYEWFLNGVSNGNTAQFQDVDTSTPGGPFEYSVRVSDGICSTSDEVIFTVNPTPQFTAVVNTNATCNTNNGSIDLTITAPPGRALTYSLAGPVTVAPTATTTGPTFNVPGLSAGLYTVTVADELSQCALPIPVTISNMDFTVAATFDGTCDPNIFLNVTVTGMPTATFTYNVINTATNQIVETEPGAGFNLTNFQTYEPDAIRSGNDYVVEVIDENGCRAFSNIVEVQQGPELTVNMDPANLCVDGTVTAIAPGATDYDWSASETGSLVSTAGNIATIATQTATTWDLSVTASDNTGALCPATATLTVAVAPLHVADFTFADECANAVTLRATPTGTNFNYVWTRSGAAPFAGGPQISTGSTGTYSVQITNTSTGCAVNSPSKPVNVNGPLTIAISPSTLPCDGAPFTLTATPSRATITNQWLFNGTVIPNQTSVSLTVDPPRAGTYTINATAIPNCQATAETNIILAASTPIELVPRQRICPEEENPNDDKVAVLDAGPNFDTYQWFTVANGNATPLNATSQTYLADEEGTYRVIGVNLVGCESQAESVVFVDCDPVIIGPTAFRPGSSLLVNGELVNQTFKLITLFVDDEDFQINIFNRWGEMVFQSEDRNFKWNGGYNNRGELLPGGTYAYVVRYRSSYDPQDGIKEKRGGVVLMR